MKKEVDGPLELIRKDICTRVHLQHGAYPNIIDSLISNLAQNSLEIASALCKLSYDTTQFI